MNAQLWGVLLGVGGGIGLAVVLAALLDRRPTLVLRMRAGLPAGVAGAVLAAGMAGEVSAFAAACIAVYRHGAAADDWPADQTLTASALAQRI